VPDRAQPHGPSNAISEFARFLRTETTGGLIMLAAAVLALITANSPLADLYQRVRDTTIGPASLHLDLTIGQWATDGLLTIFFLVVGLELKRELVTGELRHLRQALLPVFAAIGGMAVPALVFLLVSAGTPGASDGWAIPVATDIAFALAVLALTASALPSSVRIFLLSLAVVDDLGAILIIAVVYTAHVAIGPLLVSVAAVAGYWLLQYLRRPGARRRHASLLPHRLVYWLRVTRLVPLVSIALGVVAWAALHASGIHATLAGVAIAFATRVKPGPGEEETPCLALEHRLQPISAGLCVPLFAFFASGVAVDPEALRALADDQVAWGVIAGLIIGKAVGVLVGSGLAVLLRLATLPADMHWRDLTAVSLLAGCGFTVSLLITELAYAGTDRHPRVILAVLLGSLTSSLLAVGALRIRVRAHLATSAAVDASETSSRHS